MVLLIEIDHPEPYHDSIDALFNDFEVIEVLVVCVKLVDSLRKGKYQYMASN